MSTIKYLLLALLCIHAECSTENPTTEDSIIEAIGDEFKEEIDKAMKRKYGDAFGGTEDDTCARHCILTPPEGLIQIMMSPFSEDVKNSFNKDMLTLVCRFANATATCVRACPETQRRLFLREIFAPIKYMCEDSHFIDHIDCYTEVWDSENERCFSAAECGPKKDDFTSKTSKTENKTKSDSEATVGSFCTVLNCGMKCAKAKLVEKCTAQGNTELVGLWKKIVESLKTIRYFESAYVIDIPGSCSQIGES